MTPEERNIWMLNRKRATLLLATLAMLMTFSAAEALAQDAEPAAEQPAVTEAPAAEATQLTEAPAADAPAATGQDAPDGQADQPADDQVPPPPRKTLFDNPMFLVVMFGGLALLWIWSSRSRKKQARKRQEMLSSLKKGDKVTSIGGIVGTVIEVRENEVTVKVDETSNVRMKFARWAIRGVGDAAKSEEPEDNK